MTDSAVTARGLAARFSSIQSRIPIGESLVGSEVMHLTVPGEPSSKARPRLSRHGVYTNVATREAEKAFGWHLRAAGITAPDEDHWLHITMDFYCGTRQRKDVDNMVKLVLDSCNGIVWIDDVQIASLTAKRFLSDPQPRTDIVVTRLGRYSMDCIICGRVAHTSGIKLGVGRQKFCSRECYDAQQRKGGIHSCSTCGGDVYKQKGRSNQEHYFCSSRCRSAYIKGKPRRITT